MKGIPSQKMTAPEPQPEHEAISLLISWPQDRNSFVWVQHKYETICVLASFNVLLVFVVLCYQGAYNAFFILPWLAAMIGATTLLVKLLIDYANSQTTCFCVSPVLFLLTFLSWFLPVISSKTSVLTSCTQLNHGLSDEFVGLLLSITLPWLLSAAPIMTWKFSCSFSLALPCMYSSILVLQLMATKSSPRSITLLLMCFLWMVSNVLLHYFRSLKASRLFSIIQVWANAFHDMRSREEQARAVLLEKELDSQAKIAKMRHFISYIFHEIRVPFNAVVLGIGHLMASISSEEQLSILKMMDSSASSMIHILNDVLDIGKIEAGKLDLEKQPFSMQEVLNSVNWAFKDTLDSKNVVFSLSIDSCTNEVLSKYDLLGDQHRVRQVLANFVSNAIKFTPCGGKVTVCVVCNDNIVTESIVEEGESLQALESQGYDVNYSETAGHKTANITVAVEDTGVGICKEDQESLFEPYTQISARSLQGGGGTGLGLSFAKRIVELAGGEIGLLSEIGKGTVFQFTMPFELIKKTRETDIKRGRSSVTVHEVVALEKLGCSSKKPKVLIVEDNLVNRKILRMLLESFSVDSEDVEDGKQALELLHKGGSYDMIMIDKEMPVMDGHEATREFRAMGVTSPIVGLTGNALDNDRREFLAAGADEFLTKPLSRHQLMNILEMYGLVMKKNKQEA